MPLTMVNSGRRVTILAIDAGRGLRGRLSAMGLVPGVQIKVVQSALHGPFIIDVKGSRIMLGRGMANRIVVA